MNLAATVAISNPDLIGLEELLEGIQFSLVQECDRELYRGYRVDALRGLFTTTATAALLNGRISAERYEKRKLPKDLRVMR